MVVSGGGRQEMQIQDKVQNQRLEFSIYVDISVKFNKVSIPVTVHYKVIPVQSSQSHGCLVS